MQDSDSVLHIPKLLNATVHRTCQFTMLRANNFLQYTWFSNPTFLSFFCAVFQKLPLPAIILESYQLFIL